MLPTDNTNPLMVIGPFTRESTAHYLQQGLVPAVQALTKLEIESQIYFQFKDTQVAAFDHSYIQQRQQLVTMITQYNVIQFYGNTIDDLMSLASPQSASSYLAIRIHPEVSITDQCLKRLLVDDKLHFKQQRGPSQKVKQLYWPKVRIENLNTLNWFLYFLFNVQMIWYFLTNTFGVRIIFRVLHWFITWLSWYKGPTVPLWPKLFPSVTLVRIYSAKSEPMNYLGEKEYHRMPYEKVYSRLPTASFSPLSASPAPPSWRKASSSAFATQILRPNLRVVLILFILVIYPVTEIIQMFRGFHLVLYQSYGHKYPMLGFLFSRFATQLLAWSIVICLFWIATKSSMKVRGWNWHVFLSPLGLGWFLMHYLLAWIRVLLHV